jgi:Arc/MetJ family transcription regulator
MRTSIVIDDKLMAEAQRITGFATKKQTIEEALRLMIKLYRQRDVRAAFGKFPSRKKSRSAKNNARAITHTR